jgi:hypothetical protein
MVQRRWNALAREVVRESAGYPYFIQEYGLELWNHAERSPMTISDLETVPEIVTDSLERSFFGPRFQLASDAEQRYLAAMAALGDPPYRSSEVATRYGAKDARGISVFRESLIQNGLIWSPRRSPQAPAATLTRRSGPHATACPGVTASRSVALTELTLGTKSESRLEPDHTRTSRRTRVQLTAPANRVLVRLSAGVYVAWSCLRKRCQRHRRPPGTRRCATWRRSRELV